jgi:hypothetical protein
MAALNTDHPLHAELVSQAERLLRFQASGQMGYRYLVRPHIARVSMANYIGRLESKNVTSAEYQRKSLDEVITILTNPREIAALEDTQQTAFTVTDFIILNRQRLHLTQEQSALLASLYMACQRDNDLKSIH